MTQDEFNQKLSRFAEIVSNRLDYLDLHMLAVLSILENKLGITTATIMEVIEESRQFINDKLNQLPEKEESNAKDNGPTEPGTANT